MHELHTLISFFSSLLEALGSASSFFSTIALTDFSSDFMVFNSVFNVAFKTFCEESDFLESLSVESLSLV